MHTKGLIRVDKNETCLQVRDVLYYYCIWVWHVLWWKVDRLHLHTCETVVYHFSQTVIYLFNPSFDSLLEWRITDIIDKPNQCTLLRSCKFLAVILRLTQTNQNLLLHFVNVVFKFKSYFISNILWRQWYSCFNSYHNPLANVWWDLLEWSDWFQITVFHFLL